MSNAFKISTSQLQLLISNLQTQAPKTAFLAGEKSYSVAQVLALAEELVATRQAMQTAKGEVTSSRVTSEQAETANTPILTAVRTTLANYFSSNEGKLAAVGVAPKKRRTPLTLEQRVTVREKNLATRIARGTKSKKQKAQITGNVTGVIVTPVTASGPAAAPSVSTTTAPAVGGAAPVSSPATAPPGQPPAPSVSTTTAPEAAASPPVSTTAGAAVSLTPLPSALGPVIATATSPLTNGSGH